MPELFTTVADLIEQVADVPAGQVRPEARFDALTNWTSLEALRLLAAIEDDLGVQLDLREYLAVTDVDGLVALIAAEWDGASR
ncbi:acyl carrier protein [Micromonospora yasonensis]|uniref:acyl carrier protein n=1 Tax=Micromonospora yasonensis TaxID=1128667 RepID=UPI002230ADF3|nr:acyl carrier protein [Micromonospora yasonensis]MCW3841245.1 acyl carrier protein [Micromonospora yasonensis]